MGFVTAPVIIITLKFIDNYVTGVVSHLCGERTPTADFICFAIALIEYFGFAIFSAIVCWVVMSDSRSGRSSRTAFWFGFIGLWAALISAGWAFGRLGAGYQ